jgi:glucose-6-phosphate 1-dehydrogenase
MDFRYSRFGVALTDPYERILLDCMTGVPLLFWRADGVEAAWKAVAPLLDAGDGTDANALPNYDPGSWGPAEGDRLLQQDGRQWLAPVY